MENQGARSQFAGGGQFKENSRNSNEASGAAISDSIARGKDAVRAAAKDATDSAGSDLQAVRDDLNHLKDTLSRFMSQASNEAVKSAREVTSAVAGQSR